MALLPQRQSGLLPKPRTQLLPLDMGASVRAEAEGHQQRFGEPQGAYIPFPTMPTWPQVVQYAKEHPLDALAGATSLVPYLGDFTGLLADSVEMAQNPSATNAALLGIGAATMAPSGGAKRMAEALFGAGKDAAGTVKRVVGEAGDVAKSMRKMDELTGLPLNPDGTVTLYHATPTKEAADAIRKTGVLKSAGEPDVYMSTAKSGTGYGDYVVEINVDPRKIEIDDEFPDGRKDFRMSVGKPGGSVTVGLPADTASRMKRKR